jgi:virulence-associated protein VapD
MNREGELISVTLVMNALKALPWFPVCVKDIRAFRVENWSDFTEFFKDEGANR